MTSSDNSGGFSRMAVDPTLGGLRDGTDFPHSGIFHALNIASGGSYAVLDGNNFDITQSDSSGNTQFVVAAGREFRDGEYLAEIATATFTQGTPATFDEPTAGNMYYLLVVNASNVLELKDNNSLTAVDIVPVPAAGDIPIAVIRLAAGETTTQRHIQFLTTGKTSNSVSIGYPSGSNYSEQLSITSDGTNVAFAGASNSDIQFTPSGSGQVDVTTGDMIVSNGNFEVPNGYSELTVVKSVTDGGAAGLVAGTPVYPTNYASGKIIVDKADATQADGKYPAIGLVYANISSGGNGKVVVNGLTGGIGAALFDAGSYSEGDVIYLSPNVGKLTNTRPNATTDIVQNIGRIVHLSSFTAGSSGTAKILVQGSGRSNDVTNDGFVTTNASSIPNSRQITAGTGIALNDGGAGSTLEVVNSAPDQTVSLTGAGITEVTGTYPNFTITSTEEDTLNSVTGRGNTTTNNITVGNLSAGETDVDGLTNSKHLVASKKEALLADFPVLGGGPPIEDMVFYINEPGPFGLPDASAHDGTVITLKNIYAAAVTISSLAGQLIDEGVFSHDARLTAANTITLDRMESITLQGVTDALATLTTGWMVIDTDSDTDTDTGILNVVEDTTPQLGGMLDVNGNSIGDGTNELLSFSETASAVNYLEITNAATTNDPKLSAAGSDTNIGIEIESKGTGLITLDGNVLMGEVVGTYGTAPRNLNLIGPDAVMRVARTSTLAYAPAMELIHLSSDGNTTNAYFDIFLETDKLQFRDRTTAGGAGQAAGIEILTLMEGTGKVGIQNPSPTADLDLVDGGTFRSTRLLTVNITADDTLTESEHAGRYCFVTGASRTITLGATTADVAAGIHYTLISNDANGFTLTSTKTMNGSSDDITVTARNAVTIIADGSNYVVLGA